MEAPSPLNANPKSQKEPAAEGVALKIKQDPIATSERPDMLPALQIGSATVQVLAPAPLTEVECILPEETMAIRDPVARAPRAMIRTHKTPSVS